MPSAVPDLITGSTCRCFNIQRKLHFPAERGSVDSLAPRRLFSSMNNAQGSIRMWQNVTAFEPGALWRARVCMCRAHPSRHCCQRAAEPRAGRRRREARGPEAEKISAFTICSVDGKKKLNGSNIRLQRNLETAWDFGLFNPGRYLNIIIPAESSLPSRWHQFQMVSAAPNSSDNSRRRSEIRRIKDLDDVRGPPDASFKSATQSLSRTLSVSAFQAKDSFEIKLSESTAAINVQQANASVALFYIWMATSDGPPERTRHTASRISLRLRLSHIQCNKLGVTHWKLAAADDTSWKQKLEY